MTSKHLKLITIFFLLVSIAAVAYYGWQKRQNLLERIAFTGKKINLDATRSPTPSPASITQLKQFADSKDWIEGINIIRVDFTTNTRATTFRYFKDAAIETAWAEFKEKNGAVPLFGSSESNNQRIVNLINGQFQCIRTLDTQAGTSIPIINQYSLATCLVPIPPGYGDFVGFMNVFLKRQPTGAEIIELEQSTAQISLDMYQRDIVKSTRPFGESLK